MTTTMESPCPGTLDELEACCSRFTKAGQDDQSTTCEELFLHLNKCKLDIQICFCGRHPTLCETVANHLMGDGEIHIPALGLCCLCLSIGIPVENLNRFFAVGFVHLLRALKTGDSTVKTIVSTMLYSSLYSLDEGETFGKLLLEDEALWDGLLAVDDDEEVVAGALRMLHCCIGLNCVTETTLNLVQKVSDKLVQFHENRELSQTTRDIAYRCYVYLCFTVSVERTEGIKENVKRLTSSGESKSICEALFLEIAGKTEFLPETNGFSDLYEGFEELRKRDFNTEGRVVSAKKVNELITSTKSRCVYAPVFFQCFPSAVRVLFSMVSDLDEDVASRANHMLVRMMEDSSLPEFNGQQSFKTACEEVLDMLLKMGLTVVLEDSVKDTGVEDGGSAVPVVVALEKFSPHTHSYVVSSRCIQRITELLEKWAEKSDLLPERISTTPLQRSLSACFEAVEILSAFQQEELVADSCVGDIGTIVSCCGSCVELAQKGLRALKSLAASHPESVSCVLDFEFLYNCVLQSELTDEFSVIVLVGSLDIMSAVVLKIPVVVNFEWIEVLRLGCKASAQPSQSDQFCGAVWACVRNTLCAAEESRDFFFDDKFLQIVVHQLEMFSKKESDSFNTLASLFGVLPFYFRDESQSIEGKQDTLNKLVAVVRQPEFRCDLKAASALVGLLRDLQELVSVKDLVLCFLSVLQCEKWQDVSLEPIAAIRGVASEIVQIITEAGSEAIAALTAAIREAATGTNQTSGSETVRPGMSTCVSLLYSCEKASEGENRNDFVDITTTLLDQLQSEDHPEWATPSVIAVVLLLSYDLRELLPEKVFEPDFLLSLCDLLVDLSNDSQSEPYCLVASSNAISMLLNYSLDSNLVSAGTLAVSEKFPSFLQLIIGEPFLQDENKQLLVRLASQIHVTDLLGDACPEDLEEILSVKEA